MRNYLSEDEVVDFFTICIFRPRNSDEKFLNVVSIFYMLLDEIFCFSSNRNQMLKIGIILMKYCISKQFFYFAN